MTKIIKKPTKSIALAEECGIHFGDGYMKIRKDNWGIHYNYMYSAHAIDDSPYSIYVKNIMISLYNINPSYERISGENDFNMLYSSKNLVNFKLSIGMPLSPKINLVMPKWVDGDDKFLAAFLRGIFDTDGSLTFKSKWGKPHTYPYIYLSLSARDLIKKLNKSLLRFNIRGIVFRQFKTNSKNDKISKLWSIGISGDENLDTFVREINFKNRKHITKYLIYKKFGFCPPRTTLPQREAILRGELDAYFLERNATPRI